MLRLAKKSVPEGFWCSIQSCRRPAWACGRNALDR